MAAAEEEEEERGLSLNLTMTSLGYLSMAGCLASSPHLGRERGPAANYQLTIKTIYVHIHIVCMCFGGAFCLLPDDDDDES